MFSPDERAFLRAELLRRAEADARISGAAITGSAAEDREDRWSDIDLAFGVVDGAGLEAVLADWTAAMYAEHGAVHHVDVRAGAWIYRVFLLAGTLQVDLAFAPSAEFGPLAPSFRLVFGAAREERAMPAPAAGDLAGFGWLYALHARSCLERGRWWQAEYMISGVRDHALALACLRLGLPTVHGRGFDQLPAEVKAKLESSLVARLDAGILWPAFRAAMAGLSDEIRLADAALGERLERTLRLLAEARA